MVGVEPLLSRRAALATGVGAAAATVAGCGDDGSPTAPGDGRTADADLPLVRRAVDREAEVVAAARRHSRRQPRLEPHLQRLVAVHENHIDVLARSSGTPASRAEPDRGPRLGLRGAARELARRERDLAGAHARAALEARSGPLARVLAGMAAAADQQAHVLEGLAVTGPGRP